MKTGKLSDTLIILNNELLHRLELLWFSKDITDHGEASISGISEGIIEVITELTRIGL